MTAVALPRPFDLSVDALRVVGEVGFNDWQRAGEQLFVAESSVQWYLGDWWLAGQERFAAEYRDGLERLAVTHGRLVEYGRVARVFPPRLESKALKFSAGSGEVDPVGVYRLSEVSWAHHRVLAAVVDEQERMVWLEDVLRQGWSTRQLEEELALASERVARPPVLTLRAEGDLRVRLEVNAAAAKIPPREYHALLLEEALREPRVLKAVARRLRALEAA